MDQDQQELAAERAEQFESIPWSQLVPDTASRNRRYLIIGATVVIGVLIELIGGRLVRSVTQPGVVVTLPLVAERSTAATALVEPLAAVQAETQPDAIPVVVPTASAGMPVTPIPPQLYSEADLMAVLPEEEIRIALMRAEWFITDYFTVDGESSAIADDTAALPDGHTAIPLPHSSPGTGISYVEWARAFHLEPQGPAQYRVSVAFRTLAGPTVGSLSRTPVRAVSVDVRVGIDGGSAVIDFPAPVEPPRALVLAAVEVPELDAPSDVLTDALAAATAVGGEPVPIVAGLDEDGWRVVVLVGDASGLRWPLTARPQR